MLDRLVAISTGEEAITVKPITAAFLTELAEALSDGNTVLFPGFGKLQLKRQGGAPPPHARFGGAKLRGKSSHLRFRVSFSKARRFSEEVLRKFQENADDQIRRG